jgi:hypothetical protein
VYATCNLITWSGACRFAFFLPFRLVYDAMRYVLEERKLSAAICSCCASLDDDDDDDSRQRITMKET